MRESPRIRRLRSDYRAMQQLRLESSVLDFESRGDPPEFYTVRFFGKGLWRPNQGEEAELRDFHEVSIDLSAAYPRTQPDMSWQTPIFHPNISASGVVCLGGYGTYWVPSLQLDELCSMLWDMIRYKNFDVESPYNREAASWVKTQCNYRLPLDDRWLRDEMNKVSDDAHQPPIPPRPAESTTNEVTFLSDVEVVDAEVISTEGQDILFIE